MRRRDFIKGISVWTALPLAVRAQPREQKRRVAVLMGGLLSDDLGGQAEAAALEAGLSELGWKVGGNIELEYRWPGAELDQVSIAANEIIAMRPDLVVSRSTPTTAIMMNRGLPIVFVLVTDPLFSGFVQSLGRPGDSVTGFSVFESSVGGKWLALLKEAAPTISKGLAVIQSRDRALRGGLSPISGNGGPNTRYDHCLGSLRQCGPYRKCA